jgi:hypothetical protein
VTPAQYWQECAPYQIKRKWRSEGLGCLNTSRASYSHAQTSTCILH